MRLLLALGLIAGIVIIWVVFLFLGGPRLEAYQLQPRPLVQTVVASGRVVAVSRVQVGSLLTGVVLERRVQEGDSVQPGDILAVLRAEDLEASVREAEALLAQLEQSTRPQAEAVLGLAEAQLAQAERESARRRDLFTRQLIARESMEQAVQAESIARSALEQARLSATALAAGQPTDAIARERLANARAQLAKTRIRAEVAGIVLTRHAEPGDLIQPGRVLFEIAREGSTEILVPLDERNLEVLSAGQAAQCIADAYPGRPFGAYVSFIAPSVDPSRGTVDIRLRVDPVPSFLRQDMTVTVNVETGRRDSALVVPNDALGPVQGETAELWRVVAGEVRRQRVGLGLRGLAMTEVTSGLAPGDWVLADPRAVVQTGDRVRLKALTPPEPGIDPASRGEIPVRLD